MCVSGDDGEDADHYFHQTGDRVDVPAGMIITPEDL
jgi:hypothetical protein